MAENTAISWCDHTVNFWIGCSKVSPACMNCYAEGQATRFFPGHWGSDAPRHLRVDAARLEAMRYERRAVKDGRRFRVFCASMSDFFEDRRDLDGARLEALDTIRQTPHLDWLVLTKRPDKIRDLLRNAMADAMDAGREELATWIDAWDFNRPPPANVWLGTTVEDQERADLRIPALLQVPAAVRFLSCEPLLGPVDLSRASGPFQPFRSIWWDTKTSGGRPPQGHGIDWVICGGESGPKARPMHPDWARGLRDQCASAGVPFLMKQWGEWAPAMGDLWWHPLDGGPQFRTRAGGRDTHAFGDGCYGAVRIGKKAAGRLLDGVEHHAFPEVIHGV